MADGFRDDVAGWRCCRDRSILRPMDRVAAEQDVYFLRPWSPSKNCPFVVGFAPRSVSGRHDACRERGENRDAACGLRPRASQLQTPQACLPPPASCQPKFNRSWTISDTPKHDDMQVRYAAAGVSQTCCKAMRESIPIAARLFMGWMVGNSHSAQSIILGYTPWKEEQAGPKTEPRFGKIRTGTENTPLASYSKQAENASK